MIFYVISDIHSAYTPMIEALNEAGFDENNPNHKIVLCGDLFDRMDESLAVYYWAVDMINKDKLIYVKGNHESLVMDCIRRGYAMGYDKSNGTFKTICDLVPNAQTFDEACNVAYAKLKPLLDNCIDYFETENYIFVHSFIPLKRCDRPAYYGKKSRYTLNRNWRTADEEEWEDARWGNPYELAEYERLPNKTLVFGHFHTSWPRHHYEGKPEWDEGADFSIYYGDGYIAIDGCVAHTDKVNVLVLEDEFI
jgi:serine/threonine protein phosphatase 1